MQLRFNDFDLYVTLLKRSYIPPMMDLFQDVFVVSQFFFNFSSSDSDAKKVKDLRSFKDRVETDERENNKNSHEHLLKVHRKIIDSI